MNREIIELREVVTKLVPMLTGKGLRVTQRGTQAYVQANTRTNKPEVVNIPSIPDNATSDFISAIQGFIDHEVGHVLFTDWKYYGGDGVRVEKASEEGRALAMSHNLFEDTFVEREIIKTFPGAKFNLAQLHEHFLEKISNKALEEVKGDAKKEFSVIFVPFVRALAGQQLFIDWMDAGKHWDHEMIKNVHMALSDETLDMIKKAKSTQDTLKCAQELHDIMFNRKEPEPEPEEQPESEQPEEEQPEPDQGQSGQPDESDGKSQDKPEKPAGEGDGDAERDHSESEPGGDEQGGDAEGDTDAEQDSEDEGAEGGKSQSGERDEADEDSDGDAGAGDADGDESSEQDGEAGKGGKPGKGGSKGKSGGSENEEADDEGSADADGDDTGAGEDDADGEGDAGSDLGDLEGGSSSDNSDQGPSAGGGFGGDSGKAMFDLDASEFDPVDLSRAISKEISEMAEEAMSGSEYSCFTRDEDRIETFDPERMGIHVQDHWVPAMEEKVQGMVGKMQKDIERMMASQSLIVRTPGHTRGKLHAPSLHRVLQNDPRVFSQKADMRSKDTAVMLLVDNSGSMAGNNISVAMHAAYALAQTLERVNITNEIMGFTTANLSRSAIAALHSDPMGGQFCRQMAIIMPVFKAFAERVTPTVKRRIASQINAQVGMHTNVDGESLEYAAMRMMPRTEKRKVMLVMSDGMPVGPGTSDHLSMIVKKLTAMGIETVGIGINTNAVEKFYPRSLVLKDVSDLPTVVMGELRRILAS